MLTATIIAVLFASFAVLDAICYSKAPYEYRCQYNLFFREWCIGSGIIIYVNYLNRRSEYKRWISFYPRFDGIRFQIGVGSYFDSRIQISLCLGWGVLYINLPIFTKNTDECDPPQYGFYYHSRAFWINKGKKVKKISMPYELIWVRTSSLRKDGTWEHEMKGGERKHFYEDKWKKILWSETYPYVYTLKRGKIQYRKATVKVEEREWRWRWFQWTTLFSLKRRTIAVDFNDEVGERTGSWKGGCTGCGYNMNDGELPEQTLRRMEKERKF